MADADDEARAQQDSLRQGERRLGQLILGAAASSALVTGLVAVATDLPVVGLGVLFVAGFFVAGRVIVAVLQGRGTLGHVAVEPDKPANSRLTASDTVRGGKTTLTLQVDPDDGSSTTHYVTIRAIDQSVMGHGETSSRGEVFTATWTTLHVDEGAATAQIPVPRSAPYSYTGQHVRLRWEAVAATVAGREHTIHARTPLEVAPGPQAIGDGICPPSNIVGESEALDLSVSPTRVQAGSTVTLTVTATADLLKTRAVRVRLVRCERVRKLPYEVQTIAEDTLHVGPLTAGTTLRWTTLIPGDGLPTLVDQDNGIQWRFTCEVDQPGPDARKSCDVWVDPAPTIDG